MRQAVKPTVSRAIQIGGEPLRVQGVALGSRYCGFLRTGLRFATTSAHECFARRAEWEASLLSGCRRTHHRQRQGSPVIAGTAPNQPLQPLHSAVTPLTCATGAPGGGRLNGGARAQAWGRV